jgi:hypothetical protein
MQQLAGMKLLHHLRAAYKLPAVLHAGHTTTTIPIIRAACPLSCKHHPAPPPHHLGSTSTISATEALVTPAVASQVTLCSYSYATATHQPDSMARSAHLDKYKSADTRYTHAACGRSCKHHHSRTEQQQTQSLCIRYATCLLTLTGQSRPT